MHKTPLIKTIERAINPTAESMGYEIVRVLMVGVGSGKATLQIMAEKPDGTMHVDDCARLSQAVSAILDVEDVMDGAYYLEISSPGIDRPLTREKDFDRYKDNEIRVEMEDAIDGQKKFKGMLRGIDQGMIALETETGLVSLPFRGMAKAKMVLTDELLKAAQKQQKEQEKLEKAAKRQERQQKRKKG